MAQDTGTSTTTAKPKSAKAKVALPKILFWSAAGIALTMVAKSAPFLFKQGQLAVHSQGSPLSQVMSPIVEAAESVQSKVNELRHAQEENERLRIENAHLRLTVEASQFDCHSKDASSITRDLGMKLTTETGSKVGRTLASISYRPPTHLSPDQLYTLAISYFKAHENEKAAVLMSFLTGLENNEQFKTPRNFLLAGVSWFRVDNLELADHYFDQVLGLKTTPENAQTQAQARLWKSLASDRLGKHLKAQFWLRELVDHNPRSTEAKWINPIDGAGGSKRGPASSDND